MQLYVHWLGSVSLTQQLHWGLEFAKFGGEKGSMRYALGTVPVLLAWPTLLLPNQVALASQFIAFAGTWFLDMRATNAGCANRHFEAADVRELGSSLVLYRVSERLPCPSDPDSTAGR